MISRTSTERSITATIVVGAICALILLAFGAAL